MRAVIGLDAGAVGLSDDEALKLAARDQFAQLLAEPGSAGVALVAALAGSARSGVAFCFGSSFCGSRGHLLGRVATSLAVSGGGSVVSGTGTDAVVGLSLCCAMPAWLDKARTKTERRGGQQTVKS